MPNLYETATDCFNAEVLSVLGDYEAEFDHDVLKASLIEFDRGFYMPHPADSVAFHRALMIAAKGEE